MPTLDEVNRQIQSFPHRYIFWTQKEIKALPEILDNGEVIKAATSGLMDNCTWLAVCTNRRLIFLNRGMIYGLRQVQFPLDRIQSIDHEFTIFFGSIRVWDGASAFTISLVLKSSILPFVRVTEEAMYAYRKEQTAPRSTPSAPVTDIAGQISKLAELKEKGYLTDAEFQAQKKKLLGH
jgi:hypothetical protein